MHKFRALLGLNLKALLSSFRAGGGKKKRAVSGVGALVLMAVLALYLSGLYSFLFASQLVTVGMLPLLMTMMPVLAVALGFFFTLFAAQSIIFAGRDNDLMLSLPVSAFTLMLSRTLALYLENLVFTIFVLIPAGVAYLVYGGGGGVWFVVSLLVCALFLALLPTLLSLIGGVILAWFSSKFTRKALISTVLYIVFFLLLMVFIFQLNFLMADLASSAAGIEQGFSGWGLPFVLLTQAVCEGSLLSLFGLIALCAIPFLLFVLLFATRYKHIITGLTAQGARSDYKLGQLASTSQRRALFQKEVTRYFGTPIYLFNTGIGLIMLLIASVAALVMRGKVQELLETMGQVGISVPLLPILAGGMVFLLSTVAVTASSISLEGRQLWILKEAPISTGDLFAVKVGFQLLLMLSCLLVSAICLTLAFSLPLVDVAVLIVSCTLFSLLIALFGLFINLCFPKLDAPNDMVVVKQSAAAMISIFGSMGLALLAVGLFVLVQGALGAIGALLICALACALGSALLLWLLATKGRSMFDAL